MYKIYMQVIIIQMIRLLFNNGPLVTMDTYPIYQSRFTNLPNTSLSF